MQQQNHNIKALTERYMRMYAAWMERKKYQEMKINRDCCL